MNLVVIDGENGILGRIAGLAAKKALQGDEVAVVNSEKILISGSRTNILENYLQKRRRRAGKFPSTPERIVKRTIRGMLKYQKGRGRNAFKKIKCYTGIPAEFKEAKMIALESKNKNLMGVKELAGMLK